MENKLTTKWLAQDVAQAVGAVITDNWVATGVAKDSRELKPGELFIALKGPQLDGHDYVVAALEAAAVAAIVDRVPAGLEGDSRLILVKDTLQALNDLASAARARSKAKIVAITGSYGKTSTKELLKLALSPCGSVHANERSLNNHWGVPFTLANMPAEADFGIFEIGTNHPGEIAPLSKLVRPHVGVITNVHEMHVANFGSIEALADEKVALFSGLQNGFINRPECGTVVFRFRHCDDKDVCSDNERIVFYRQLAHTIGQCLRPMSFGDVTSADCRLLAYKQQHQGLWVRVAIEHTVLEYTLPVVGEHWVWNSLAVLCVILALDLDVRKAMEAMRQIVVPAGRGVQHQVNMSRGQLTVIDESYNAGPESMRAALQVLGATNPTIRQGRRIAVLGDMLELGAKSQAAHEALVADLQQNRIDLVFTCGEAMRYLDARMPAHMRGGYAVNVADLLPTVIDSVQAGDVVMVKGSRGQYASQGRMYAFVEALLGLEARKVEKIRVYRVK